MRLWPARSAKHQEAEVVADLDAMLSEPIAFRFQGKTHIIKPISTAELLKYSNAAFRVSEVMKDEKATHDSVTDAAYGVISSVCSSITRKDLQKMNQVQVGALLNLVIECVTGKIYARGEPEAEKKKG